MIVRVGESQRLDVNSGTVGGILLHAYMVGAAVNTEIVGSDWLSQLFQCKTTLHRKGIDYTIHNDNLLLLGTYNMRKNSYERFLNGYDLVLPGVATANIKIRAVYIKFRSPIRIGQGERLSMEFTANTGMFSANVNTSLSYVDFIQSPTIGYEYGIPQTKFSVIQTNASNQEGVNCDNVKHIEFINFDQDDWTNQVLSNISLSSDKLNYSATVNQLIASDGVKWPMNKPYRFSTGLPATGFAPQMGLDWLPQSLTIFEAGDPVHALNQARVMLTFNSANVNASQNYIGFDTLYVDPRSVMASVNRQAKHAKENIARLVSGVGS